MWDLRVLFSMLEESIEPFGRKWTTDLSIYTEQVWWVTKIRYKKSQVVTNATLDNVKHIDQRRLNGPIVRSCLVYKSGYKLQGFHLSSFPPRTLFFIC